ncbi:MAG: thioredoxin [Acidobacteriota bacterium]
MSKLVQVDDASFEAKVLGAERPVMADFSAAWCGPCKKLKPVVEELAGEYDGRVDIVHVDVDEARQTASRYGVMSVPTLLFFDGGEVTDQVTGLATKESLQKRLEQLLSARAAS